MRKHKKIKTTIVEKFKYDGEEYGIKLAPELLLKLLEFAREEAKSDIQLHSLVSRAYTMAQEKEDCLWPEDYEELIAEVIPVKETPAEMEAVEETPA